MANGACYSVREAKALHEVGATNHGWYMTEAEHRGVLEVIERLEGALALAEQALLDHSEWCGFNKDAPGSPIYNRALRAGREARDAD